MTMNNLMMKIRKEMERKEQERQEAQKSSKTLKLKGKKESLNDYKDSYEPLFPPIKIKVREYDSAKNGLTEQFLVFKVERFAEDGLPFVFINMYQSSEKGYKGYLQGKSIHFPLEMLGDVFDSLDTLDDECAKRKIE